MLSRQDLFARLAEGHAAGTTVITPNRRLAQALAREFDDFQIKRNLAVWEAPDILPFGAFVERLYEDALYSDSAAQLPLLLTGAQERALWESIIRASRWGEALLAVPQAAADAARAWELSHAWRIAGALGSFPGNDDTQAFADWAKEYAGRCAKEGHTDHARLPDAAAPLLKENALRKPKRLVAYAFDAIAPQAADFLAVCGSQGIEVLQCAAEKRESRAEKRTYLSAREELNAAAQWARARLEAGAKRIGVVVPELGERRKEVARVFARTLQPAHNLPGAQRKALPFNLSLGAPLSDYPVVRAALGVLELAAGEVAFEQASKLIRSPFLGGAQPEMAQRALLDARLRRKAPARVTLGKLVGLIERCPVLRQRLEAVFAVPRLETGSPHEWGRHFTALLEAAGFPDRKLDSDEFQARAKFNEALAELAKLERIERRMDFSSAFSRLIYLCNDTLFQPESPDAPIQVLGALESLGLAFDALWVSGLTDDAWPLRARPSPFLPPALQKKAGIPEASPEKTLARCERITAGWLAAAAEVIVSHPAHEEDRALLASPLIRQVVVGKTAAGPYPKYRDGIFAARRLESLPDGQAPELAVKSSTGGTRILVDQSACPFRAFARHRLSAQALEEPVEGLDARARGKLLHSLMKEIWAELKGSAGLQGDCSAAIERAAAAAVRDAKLEEPFAALERKRLAKLARDWLEVERERAPFEILHLEKKVPLQAGVLALAGRIDRMDRLESGGHALIDYKTGKPTPNDWMGERPEDPQLPLYALSAKEDVAAVAFAKLKTGEMRYMGFSRAKDAIPKVKTAENWAALVAGWKKELEALGSGFASGDARVDPKDGLATCRYCDLHALCRVYEKVDVLKEEEGE